jgi:hypothetical protein
MFENRSCQVNVLNHGLVDRRVDSTFYRQINF